MSFYKLASLNVCFNPHLHSELMAISWALGGTSWNINTKPLLLNVTSTDLGAAQFWFWTCRLKRSTCCVLMRSKGNSISLSHWKEINPANSRQDPDAFWPNTWKGNMNYYYYFGSLSGVKYTGHQETCASPRMRSWRHLMLEVYTT